MRRPRNIITKRRRHMRRAITKRPIIMHTWPMLITWKQAITIIRPQSCLLKPTASKNDNRPDGGASPCAAVFYFGECCCAVGGAPLATSRSCFEVPAHMFPRSVELW